MTFASLADLLLFLAERGTVSALAIEVPGSVQVLCIDGLDAEAGPNDAAGVLETTFRSDRGVER